MRFWAISPRHIYRVRSTGNIALVPEFSDVLLLNVGFAEKGPLQLAGSGNRLKGWQAAPVGDIEKGFDFGVALQPAKSPEGKKQVLLGCLPAQPAKTALAQAQRAMLAQEIRNFRAGHYTFSIRACGGGTSREVFNNVIRKHCTCRLVIYRHTEVTKNPLKMQQVESMTFQPEFAEEAAPKYQNFVLAKLLDSRVPGVNFSVGLGLGVAVVVEKTIPGTLDLPVGSRAFLRIDSVELVFNPRERNDDVQV